ncbi:MAG TPA: hypothetical protein VM008_16575 [Phycisphaerae bacterium]|nr:hypothetical protein [Phycisphaerae bacterium]
MIFLIEYNRPEGKLVSFRRFESSERRAAQDAKLELELELHRRGAEHEVVILEADSEEELRQGYRRYFEDLPTLLRSAIGQLKALETR